MKLAPIFMLSFISALSFGANALTGDTPLKLGTVSTIIQGKVPSPVKIDGLAFYVAVSPKDSACTFAEDYSDSGRALKMNVRIAADDTYKLIVPLTGLRGACAYALDSVYFNVRGGAADSNIKLDTSAADKTPFQNLKTIFCEFGGVDEIGLCWTRANLNVDMSYGISKRPTTYTLDIKDAKDLPGHVD